MVKALDYKSDGLCPREFESYWCRAHHKNFTYRFIETEIIAGGLAQSEERNVSNVEAPGSKPGISIKYIFTARVSQLAAYDASYETRAGTRLEQMVQYTNMQVPVAQWIRRETTNLEIAGSNPAGNAVRIYIFDTTTKIKKKKNVLHPVGFEPTHPKITELESIALDHSATDAHLSVGQYTRWWVLCYAYIRGAIWRSGSALGS